MPAAGHKGDQAAAVGHEMPLQAHEQMKQIPPQGAGAERAAPAGQGEIHGLVAALEFSTRTLQDLYCAGSVSGSLESGRNSGLLPLVSKRPPHSTF